MADCGLELALNDGKEHLLRNCVKRLRVVHKLTQPKDVGAIADVVLCKELLVVVETFKVTEQVSIDHVGGPEVARTNPCPASGSLEFLH